MGHGPFLHRETSKASSSVLPEKQQRGRGQEGRRRLERHWVRYFRHLSEILVRDKEHCLMKVSLHLFGEPKLAAVHFL